MRKMRLLLLFVFVHQIFARSQPAQLTLSNFHRCLNPFSLDILKKLEYSNKNIIYSPMSIGMALGMVLEGAQNEEKEKLFKLLHCDNFGNRDTIHQQFKALLDEYKDMATRNENPRNTTVELANLAMIQEGLTIPATFTDALKRDYEAAISNENFATNGQQVVDKINKFVKERTHDLIEKLFDEPLDSSSVMVLINTIYFKAFWKTFFERQWTHNATFHNADKTEKTVIMMRRMDTYLPYVHSDKLKASIVELPYLGEMSMFIVVPDEKYGLPNVIQSWEHNDLAKNILPQMSRTNVNIHLPKFDFDHSINLKDVFKSLGVDIENALQAVHSSLKISGAVHKAKICTHETGTEAAAVTSLIAAGSSLKPPPKDINADHPFLFLITDTKTKINLFAGVVNQFN